MLVRMLPIPRWQTGEAQERTVVIGLVELTKVVERNLGPRHQRQPAPQFLAFGEGNRHAEGHAAERYRPQLFLYGAQEWRRDRRRPGDLEARPDRRS